MSNLDRIATLEYRIERQEEIIAKAHQAKCSAEFIRDCSRMLKSFKIELAAVKAAA